MDKRFTIHHDADGTPYARVYLGETVLGRPIRRRRSFPGMTDEEAAAAIREWIANFDPSDVTLSGAMTEYIENLEAAGNSPNTIETYDLYARRYFTPLADKPLRSITTPMLDAHFADLRRRGAGTGPLSARTVNGARFFLSGVFRHYVAAGLCETNPVTGTISQGVGYSNEAAFLDDYDLRLVVAAVAEELAETATENPHRLRHCAAFAINTGLAAGLRIGEVCALRRRDIERSRQTIVVCGNVTECDGTPTRRDRTKSKKTRRVKVTGQYLAALASFYEWQGAYLTAPDGDTPIVTTDGAFVSPNRLTKQATKILRDAGVGGATFHTLRHTHAAHLLANGIDPKVVQERLGHADVATTLRLYGHVLPGRDEQAAQTMARLISDNGATGNGRATTGGDPLG